CPVRASTGERVHSLVWPDRPDAGRAVHDCVVADGVWWGVCVGWVGGLRNPPQPRTVNLVYLGLWWGPPSLHPPYTDAPNYNRVPTRETKSARPGLGIHGTLA